MSKFHSKALTTLLILSFILEANSYSILFESLACYSAYPYTGVIQNILLLSFATLFLTDWISLKNYTKIGFLYKALPWMGLVYMGTYELWHRKSVGAVSIELGLLIAICCCLLVLFRLLKLVIGLLRQKLGQHPRHGQVELTGHIQQQQQQQQRSDDQLIEERSPFISQLRKGGIMPWRGVKVVLICIVNGAVMVGSQELVLESGCILSLAVAMIMLIIGITFFGLFRGQYVLEEGQGEVLPSLVLPPV